MDRDEPTPSDSSPLLTAEDIEAAYERALMAMETVEAGVEQLDMAAAAVQTEIVEEDENLSADALPADPADDLDETSPADEPQAPVLHPREIIEAALFVGGQSLTTKRLSQMLGPHESPERMDGYIESLNAAYHDEGRPYEIDFGEGGYRLVLRPEFESVRSSVFGAGPKDVKLSQDALEVLALVAYQQPTTKAALEEAEKTNTAGLLRQLLRRQLVALDRTDDGEVTYITTARFLDVFGLRSLDDLPFPEDLELK